jgi:hypothetical protein
MRLLIGLILLISLAAAACDRQPRRAASTADNAAARESAREACISQELVTRAREGVVALEEFHADDSPLAATSGPALVFARVLEEHAQLRLAAHAHADSALNHARTPADSARFMQAAQGYLPRRPEPGSLEENVAAAWMRDFARLRADDDHRCNWDF